MSQRSLKSEEPDTSSNTIEEQRRQPAIQWLAAPIQDSIENGRSSWSGIFSQLNQAGFPMMKGSEEIAQAGKDTIDALTKSGAALVEGVGEISQHIMAQTHKTVTANLATSKEIFNIKTPSDWMDLQSKLAGDFMTATVAHMAQLSQLSAKVINQTCEPLKTHFGATLGKTGCFL